MKEKQTKTICARNGLRPEFLVLVCYRDSELRNDPKIVSRISKCTDVPTGMLQSRGTPVDSLSSLLAVKERFQEGRKPEGASGEFAFEGLEVIEAILFSSQKRNHLKPCLRTHLL